MHQQTRGKEPTGSEATSMLLLLLLQQSMRRLQLKRASMLTQYRRTVYCPAPVQPSPRRWHWLWC
jgi:hypothetical protein